MFFQSQNPGFHGTPMDLHVYQTCTERSQPGLLLLQTTSINVIIVGIITVICISRGRVLVLTPEDEHEGSQGKQSVEGRHLFSGGWLPGLNREIPSVKNSPSQDTFEETLWDELPQGGDFLTEMRAKLRRLGKLSGVFEPGGGFSSKAP